MSEHYVTAVAVDVARALLCCRCGFVVHTTTAMATTVWEQHRITMEQIERRGAPDGP